MPVAFRPEEKTRGDSRNFNWTRDRPAQARRRRSSRPHEQMNRVAVGARRAVSRMGPGPAGARHQRCTIIWSERVRAVDAAAARSCRPRAADCVRQRRQPDARARTGRQPRDGHPRRARRQPLAAGARPAGRRARALGAPARCSACCSPTRASRSSAPGCRPMSRASQASASTCASSVAAIAAALLTGVIVRCSSRRCNRRGRI